VKTLRLLVDPANLDSDASHAAIDTAAAILRRGGLVAFPTETVYGLGANALDAQAVESIFVAKRRPAWDPLIVHISDETMLSRVVAPSLVAAPLTQSATALISIFWPGPLTLLLPRSEDVPPIVTAGRQLIGVRMPAHPVARALITTAGIPIAAPSANTFGHVSPTRASHVLEDLDGRIDAVVDAGEATHGLESTVVDASRESVVVYRPGIISLKQIREACGSAVEWRRPATKERRIDTLPESMPSPGLGIRHYAPRAHLLLVGGEAADQPGSLLQAIEQASAEQKSIGIMLPANFLSTALCGEQGKMRVFNWGNWDDSTQLAHRLFAGLRELDSFGVDLILCPLPPSEGIGAAIRDRLLKAAKTE
jgi:L-threonylcarbamoyladenylate synthase